ncbi:Large-conductance mechanosensitive channel [Listeria grayi]|uniref:Large-conductance mechanosensitive channel n=2 Tax=Listeria grayi TaxID=1641 RepID=A0A829R923_LISGR|nr:large conductance mechanosensitive channel protein MscL [Listeria grayi]EUJ29289.1 large-conductance mechanosensitive channel [Listeria grayi FSL F6-1183]MBC1922231.1 large conductance mechanosensitive channel protein MscL [Listeria grayi]STY45532.1 Large-conductance mechanosensitive channel [Listeria grayi]VEI32498.1 Large-conductance mechanosensitive channel [Listeria grayi]
MKNFIAEFKTFALRGNVLDLAVGVVIGAAFGKIVSSLVDNIIMPLVGLILGGLDFSKLSFTVGDAVIKYGAFIQSIVDFVIIAFAIFLFIKLINTLSRKKTEEPEPEPTVSEQYLEEIRNLLRNQNQQ